MFAMFLYANNKSLEVDEEVYHRQLLREETANGHAVDALKKKKYICIDTIQSMSL